MSAETATERPLRILLVSNHRRFKINFRAFPWAYELAARGHDVDVMCHADTERWRTHIEHVNGFRIIESPDMLVGALRQGWDPICAWRRRALLFRENKQYDIIHCLDTRLAVVLPALAYARKKQIPIVSDWIDWWGRGGLIKERRPLWYQWLFAPIEVHFEEAYRNKLDGLTTISHALMERGIKLGIERKRCLVIPGGANIRAFAEVPPKSESRSMLGIPEDVPVVCFSGLDVLIDLPLAVQAFELLLKRDPRTIMLLAGPAEHDVSGMVSCESVMANVKALGPVPYKQLPKYLAAADLFLMPYSNKVSNVGRWPNKIGDYMCVGRPTISNPVGEVKWLFERYDIGALADPTPQAMADAAVAYLDDPERASRAGEVARETAYTVFAWDKLIVNLERYYFDLLDGRLGPLHFQQLPAAKQAATFGNAAHAKGTEP
ncbi:MAG: glycosyltransferase family 4 protein [Candidatus Hydrogenedentes bacterium]|nr:glycosyltransferase family 4 protein [Candidatus Hydrogenedentota bacterium]